MDKNCLGTIKKITMKNSIMKKNSFKIFKYILFVLSASVLTTSCVTDPADPVVPDVDLNFRFEATMGDAVMKYNENGLTNNSVQYNVSKFRFYLSNPRFLSSTGDTIQAKLLDSAGKETKYNVALINFDKEELQKIKFQVQPGNYKGFIFDMGVPKELNHVDASVMDYPLSPDADMYWAWDPGYIFMKLEGKSLVNGKFIDYLFHAGMDSNVVSISVIENFSVGSSGSSFKIKADINKFFVDIKGENFPDLSDTKNRFANGGFPTNYMVRQARDNMAFSF